MPFSRRSVLALAAFVGLSGVSSGAWSQASSPDNDYTPMSGQAGKDVVWVPTPDVVVERMLQMAEVKAGDRVVDLGSGDGKIAIAAARIHGARAWGLEYNPKMVALSNRLAREAGVADKVSFQEADIFKTDFSSATVVTMYLLPQLNLRLRPLLFAMAPGTRVVSHSFDMGDWLPDEFARAGTGQVYRWTIPANASGHWRLTAPRLARAPSTLEFTQKYQMLEGDARFEGLTARIVRPELSGDALSFGVRDTAGAMLRFTGKVSGNRIVGTVANGASAPVPFEAERTEAAQPIAGVAPSEEEDGAALRALGASQ
ncbi:class I SAM-dependent methyltransferase [Aquincola sp. MAHUQ-54]|uniref:Class I SAM-dependent methyltransferase n=1 Tax=Aquincola agrisoli TaxID=3119538 RepID=A0AAW9QIQ3_9BURK